MTTSNTEINEARADALMTMARMELLDFDIALAIVLGDVPLDVDAIKAIISGTDNPAYFEQRFNFN